MNKEFKLGNVHKVQLIQSIDGDEIVMQDLELRNRKFNEFLSALSEKGIDLNSKIIEATENTFFDAVNRLEELISRLNRRPVDRDFVENEFSTCVKKGDLHYDGEKLLVLSSSPKIYFDEQLRWNYFDLKINIELDQKTADGCNLIRYFGLVEPAKEIFFDNDFIKAAYVFKKRRSEIFIGVNI